MIPALTGIRGAAALWVFLFHLPLTASLPLIRDGFLGVDVFFVLSGFVLSLAYAGKPPSGLDGYWRFLVTRAARIWPLHAVALLVLACLVFALPGFADRYSSDKFAWGDLPAHISLTYLWSGHHIAWNVPSWSLSAEAFAYLLFPFLLSGITRLVRSPRLALIGAVLALSAWLAVFAVIGFDKMERPSLWILRLAPEFVAGCLLYRAYALGGLDRVVRPAPLVAADRFLSWRPVFLLGEYSFSLYMTHWTVIQVMNWLALPNVAAEASITIAATAALTLAGYRFIEQPGRKLGRRIARRDTLSSPSGSKLRATVVS